MASCYAKLSRKAKKILVWERWGNIFHWQSSGIHGPEDIAGGGRAALDLLPGAVAAGPNTQSVEGHALPALADGDSLIRAPATVEGPHQAGIAGGAGAPGLDGTGEGGHRARWPGILCPVGGGIEADKLPLRQSGAARAPPLGQADVGHLRRPQAHEAAPVGVYLHHIGAQQHPAGGHRVAPPPQSPDRRRCYLRW